MKITEDILKYILKLDDQTYKNYLMYTIAGVFVALSGLTYFIYIGRSKLIDDMNTVRRLAKKSSLVAHNFKKVQGRKQQIKDLLRRQKTFDIKSFFESYYKDQGVKPEPNWSAISAPIPGNEQLNEVLLQASFKNITTQKLVSMLGSINNNNMVYVKSLGINKGDGQTISLDITLGSFSPKGTRG